jgi:AraC-like DNA-binding protein
MILTSDDMPDHLPDRARFNLWRDMHAQIAAVEVGISANRPFQATLDAMQLGSLTYARLSGTINSVSRTAQSIRTDPHDSYSLVINMGDAPIGGTYRTQDIELAHGGGFLDGAERQTILGADHNRWMHIGLPRALLDRAFPRIRDRQGLAIRPDREPMKLLRSYLQLMDTAGPTEGTLLADHVAQTIVDLIGATGAKGDEAELAGLRGLRAARLQAVLADIGKFFCDPAISAHSVGRRLGISSRYVQDLLASTGTGFSERVIELRLQRARLLLGDVACREMRIGDIALDVGFNDISYFNRSFRRRFGCSPGAAR